MVTCIEVLEHIPEEDALRAIRAMAAAAPRILFSSTPVDLDEPTHVNVRPTAYWLALWAEAGFAPSVTHDAGYLAPHAYILERSEEGRSKRDLIAFADRVRHRVALSQLGSAISAVQTRLAASEVALSSSEETRIALEAQLDAFRSTNSTLLDDVRRTSAALGAAKAAASRAENDLLATQAELIASKSQAEAERQAALTAQSAHQAVLNSTTWRAATGLHRATNVMPRRLRLLARKTAKLLWWTVTLQLGKRIRMLSLSPSAPAAARLLTPSDLVTSETVTALVNARFPDSSALRVYAAPRADRRRLTVVTDSIGRGSLYGGVGTALIFAALAARRLGADLRLVTRTELAETSPVAALLKVNGVRWDSNIESIYAPRAGYPGGHDVPASEDDFFLTTSWWTTWATRQSIRHDRIAYLVQEDERMFYPLGDDYLRCTETLSSPDLLYLVNSEILLEHFQNDGLVPGATAFEPSFPESLYHPALDTRRRPADKRRFFFYARPHNARNLYWRGLEAVASAIEEGVLDPAEWDFYFAGHGNGRLSLPGGVRPIIPGPMAWADYAAFVRGMDVGLSLMYTPHPSYPPLDLVASGSVVVTNRFGLKRDLDQYSSNIICSDLDVPSLVAALRQATALAENSDLRIAQFSRSSLQRDWAISMAPALDRMVRWSEA
jgi:hypothetical protein